MACLAARENGKYNIHTMCLADNWSSNAMKKYEQYITSATDSNIHELRPVEVKYMILGFTSNYGGGRHKT